MIFFVPKLSASTTARYRRISGGAQSSWWRRRKSNPRPAASSRSSVYGSSPSTLRTGLHTHCRQRRAVPLSRFPSPSIPSGAFPGSSTLDNKDVDSPPGLMRPRDFAVLLVGTRQRQRSHSQRRWQLSMVDRLGQRSRNLSFQ